jgi:DNA-binding beta-propeller fold protein YncE
MRGTESAKALETMAALRSKIKHVIFIIKENRTYDQVLGDLEIGNGDPKLAILGEALTPNHHDLARKFVTFDNFHDSGEQSSTGWTWSTAARVTDILEKTAPVNYAGRGLSYEAEGGSRNMNMAASKDDRRKWHPETPDDDDLLPGTGHVTSPDAEEDGLEGQGFLWNAAIRAGLSVRNYGFANDFIYEGDGPNAVPLTREPAKTGQAVYVASDTALASRSDPYFRGYDQKFPDYWRVQEWMREFDLHNEAGTVPALSLVRISHDHFGEFDKAVDGVNTVETQMADNDYALGLIVEKVANSKVADETLIFVIEDDAQGGADHVDARRSIVFIAGPYVKKRELVSTRYTTVNVLRTIEDVLGLKPMGLNDALALPMADAFDLDEDDWTFRARVPQVLRTTQLPLPPERSADGPMMLCPVRSAAYWSKAMRGQNFALEDRLDTEAFNAALWTGLRGHEAPAPTRHGRDMREGRASLLARPAACARS